METLRSVFSGFQIDVDYSDIFKMMNTKPGSDSFDEINSTLNNVKDDAVRLLEPGIVFIIKDNDLKDNEDIPEQLRKCKYILLAFCTVGNKISEKANEYSASNLNLESTVLDKIGDMGVLKTRAAADNFIKKVLISQLFGATDRFTPGEEVDLSFQAHIVEETGAVQLFGVQFNEITDIITPLKSLTFIYGCDPSIAVPTVAYDCDSCLRRDCEYCYAK